jgi:integrase/recombinase XerC
MSKDISPSSPDKTAALIESFLSGRNPLTIRAYKQDLADFAAFLSTDNVGGAARRLLSLAPGDANALALAYRTKLVERGLQGATINRRLSALRAMVRLARVFGLVPWALEVSNLKTESYRDLRGPGIGALRRVLAILTQREDPKAKRDLALLRVLHDLGLRRAEVVSFDLEHLDLSVGTLSVLGKGRAQRVFLTLPQQTRAALSDWLSVRGMALGPLFRNFDRARKGGRLTGNGLYRLVRGYGLGRVHGLRHLSLTTALDVTGGDLRRVQRFSRHKDVRVLGLYDDARTDLGGEVAKLVAENL